MNQNTAIQVREGVEKLEALGWHFHTVTVNRKGFRLTQYAASYKGTVQFVASGIPVMVEKALRLQNDKQWKPLIANATN